MGVFASAGSGNLDSMNDIMDSLKSQAILAERMVPSVHGLKLDDQWTFQQVNDHIQIYPNLVQDPVLQCS